MSSTKKSHKRISPTLLAASAVALVIAGTVGLGGMSLYAMAKSISSAKPLSVKIPIVKLPRTSPPTDVGKVLDALHVPSTDYDLSSSPIPDLKIEPLNLALPKLPAKDMLKNFTYDKNIGYAGGAVNIEMPTIDVSGMIQKNMPTNIPTGNIPSNVQPAPTNIPINNPTVTPPTTEAPAQSQVNAANCAAFKQVPSCSYVGDANGKTLCDQCKAAGL